MKKLTYKRALQECYYARNWYRDDIKHINETFEDSRLFAALLAATSPRVSVSRSYKLSIRIYRQFKAGQAIDYSGILPAAIGNIKRALSGQELSGPKVRSFYQNLIGNENAVTIDVWMLKFFGIPNKGLTKKQYQKLADKIRRYAKKVGLTASELQAILWTYTRKQENRKNISYSRISKRMEFQPTLWGTYETIY